MKLLPTRAGQPTLHFCWSRGDPILHTNIQNNLCTHRIDPESKGRNTIKLAWVKDHVGTMAELAKYTEPDPEVRTSSVWLLVEREQERR